MTQKMTSSVTNTNNSLRIVPLEIKSKVSVDIRTIGPEEARRLLATNSSNRSISSNNVARYTKDILEGRWPLNGETITLDPDGNLLDGQHRLTAVVNADRAVDFIVITGISPEARSTMDTGKSRNSKDIVKMIGNVDQEGLIAASIRKIDLYNRGKLNSTSGSNPTPNHETERLFKIHGDGLQESLEVVKRLGRGTTGKTLLLKSLTLFLFYMWHSEYPQETEEFFGKLFSGVGLDPDTGVYHLREKLVRAKSTNRKVDKLTWVEQLALTIKAFKKDYARESVKSLRYTKAESFPDLFPNPYYKG